MIEKLDKTPNQPTFFLKQNPVRAAGIAAFYEEKDLIYFLLNRKINPLSPFNIPGGRTSNEDIININEGNEIDHEMSIRATAFRKANEKSGLQFEKIIPKKIWMSARKLQNNYFAPSKYCTFFFRVEQDCKNKMLASGDYQFDWISSEKILALKKKKNINSEIKSPFLIILYLYIKSRNAKNKDKFYKKSEDIKNLEKAIKNFTFEEKKSNIILQTKRKTEEGKSIPIPIESWEERKTNKNIDRAHKVNSKININYQGKEINTTGVVLFYFDRSKTKYYLFFIKQAEDPKLIRLFIKPIHDSDIIEDQQGDIDPENSIKNAACNSIRNISDIFASFFKKSDLNFEKSCFLKISHQIIFFIEINDFYFQFIEGFNKETKTINFIFISQNEVDLINEGKPSLYYPQYKTALYFIRKGKKHKNNKKNFEKFYFKGNKIDSVGILPFYLDKYEIKYYLVSVREQKSNSISILHGKINPLEIIEAKKRNLKNLEILIFSAFSKLTTYNKCLKNMIDYCAFSFSNCYYIQSSKSCIFKVQLKTMIDTNKLEEEYFLKKEEKRKFFWFFEQEIDLMNKKRHDLYKTEIESLFSFRPFKEKTKKMILNDDYDEVSYVKESPDEYTEEENYSKAFIKKKERHFLEFQ